MTFYFDYEILQMYFATGCITFDRLLNYLISDICDNMIDRHEANMKLLGELTWCQISCSLKWSTP